MHMHQGATTACGRDQPRRRRRSPTPHPPALPPVPLAIVESPEGPGHGGGVLGVARSGRRARAGAAGLRPSFLAAGAYALPEGGDRRTVRDGGRRADRAHRHPGAGRRGRARRRAGLKPPRPVSKPARRGHRRLSRGVGPGHAPPPTRSGRGGSRSPCWTQLEPMIKAALRAGRDGLRPRPHGRPHWPGKHAGAQGPADVAARPTTSVRAAARSSRRRQAPRPRRRVLRRSLQHAATTPVARQSRSSCTTPLDEDCAPSDRASQVPESLAVGLLEMKPETKTRRTWPVHRGAPEDGRRRGAPNGSRRLGRSSAMPKSTPPPPDPEAPGRVDILDALAGAWTAGAMRRHRICSCGGDVDARGLRMEVIA